MHLVKFPAVVMHRLLVIGVRDIRSLVSGGLCKSLKFWAWLLAHVRQPCSFPWAFRVWRTRSASDISLGMYYTFLTDVALWLIYGFAMASVSRIVTNVVALVFAHPVPFMKLRLSRQA